MADHPDASAVRAVSCLAGFTDDDAAAAAAKLAVVALAPGEALFRQGDPGNSVYVLVGGQVEVRVDGQNGDHEIATIGPGTFVGEFALLVDDLRTRTVVGRTEATLWELPRTAFEAAIAAGETWATRFLIGVARELASQMLAVDRQLVALLDEGKAGHAEPAARVRELEKLRRQLSGEWTF